MDFHSSQKVIVEISGDQVKVDLNKSLPSGLLVYELIINSLKHTFPVDFAGEKRIKIQLFANFF